MKHDNNEYFSLPTLLKHGDLEIRQIAAEDPSFSINEYFDMLSQYLDLAPDVDRAFIKFAERDGDRDAAKHLENMVAVMTKLKANKFIPEFYSILDAYGKGDWRLAATLTRQIMFDFKKMSERIGKAKTKKPESLPDPDAVDIDDGGGDTADGAGDTADAGNAAAAAMSLNDYLKYLDDEEANRKLVILAVDDSPVILKSVSSVLGSEYKVYTLPKPTMLEKLLTQITPELFLLDYKMPELSGFDLIPIIRNFEEHKDTPIIFLTSEGTLENVTAAIALGASDFVVKPFQADVLRERIRAYIVRKKTF